MQQGGANHGLRAYGIGQIVSLGKEGSKGKKAGTDKVVVRHACGVMTPLSNQLLTGNHC